MDNLGVMHVMIEVDGKRAALQVNLPGEVVLAVIDGEPVAQVDMGDMLQQTKKGLQSIVNHFSTHQGHEDWRELWERAEAERDSDA